jgi:hypothetical protein
MEQTTRLTYEAPTIIIVEVMQEGVICGSGGTENYTRQEEEDW